MTAFLFILFFFVYFLVTSLMGLDGGVARSDINSLFNLFSLIAGFNFSIASIISVLNLSISQDLRCLLFH